MRFVAALWVVEFHLWHNYFGIAIGELGTDIFLVLTGAAAAYTQVKQVSDGGWWEYVKARYRRLYVTFIPLFLVTLLAKWNEADVYWAVKSFFFVPIPDRLPVIGGTWMLSMFLLFYFVFSVCFLARTEKILWLLFATWAALMVMYNVFGWKPGLPGHWANLFFSERNFEFIMGYGAGIVLRHGCLKNHQAKIFSWAGLVGIISGTILLNIGINSISRMIMIGIPVTVFIIGLASLELKGAHDGLVGLFTLPWLVWLGGTAYVLYLSHSIFFQVWSWVLPVTVAWTLPMTVGAIITGAFGYVFWEQPVLAYLKSGKWISPLLPVIKTVAGRTQKGK